MCIPLHGIPPTQFGSPFHIYIECDAFYRLVIRLHVHVNMFTTQCNGQCCIVNHSLALKKTQMQHFIPLVTSLLPNKQRSSLLTSLSLSLSHSSALSTLSPTTLLKKNPQRLTNLPPSSALSALSSLSSELSNASCCTLYTLTTDWKTQYSNRKTNVHVYMCT